MALLMLTQQPAEARYRGLNASETQQMPEHCLSRSDDRLAGSRLHCLDNRMRAEIETRGDQPVGLRVPGAERQVQNRIWFWLGEAKAVGDAEVRTGDGLDPAFAKKRFSAVSTASLYGEIVVTRWRPSARQAAKMLSVAVVAGTPAI